MIKNQQHDDGWVEQANSKLMFLGIGLLSVCLCMSVLSYFIDFKGLTGKLDSERSVQRHKAVQALEAEVDRFTHDREQLRARLIKLQAQLIDQPENKPNNVTFTGKNDEHK